MRLPFGVLVRPCGNVSFHSGSAVGVQGSEKLKAKEFTRTESSSVRLLLFGLHSCITCQPQELKPLRRNCMRRTELLLHRPQCFLSQAASGVSMRRNKRTLDMLLGVVCARQVGTAMHVPQYSRSRRSPQEQPRVLRTSILLIFRPMFWCCVESSSSPKAEILHGTIGHLH